MSRVGAWLRSEARAQVLLISLALLLTVAALWTLLLRSPEALRPPCSQVPARLEGVWDGARRAEIEASYRQSGVPGAREAFERGAAALDDAAQTWVSSYTHACLETRVVGRQDEHTLSVLGGCYWERRFEMMAVADALAWGTPPVIAELPALLEVLEPISACEAVERVLAQPFPAGDLRVEVDMLRHRRAELEVRRALGVDVAALRADARELLRDAEALGWEPELARVRALSESVAPA